MTTSKMLNKLLIKMILKELLQDVFKFTNITYECSINKEYSNIKVVAKLGKRKGFIQKYDSFYIDSWVDLIRNYDSLKNQLKYSLVDNISTIKEK